MLFCHLFKTAEESTPSSTELSKPLVNWEALRRVGQRELGPELVPAPKEVNETPEDVLNLNEDADLSGYLSDSSPKPFDPRYIEGLDYYTAADKDLPKNANDMFFRHPLHTFALAQRNIYGWPVLNRDGSIAQSIQNRKASFALGRSRFLTSLKNTGALPDQTPEIYHLGVDLTPEANAEKITEHIKRGGIVVPAYGRHPARLVKYKNPEFYKSLGDMYKYASYRLVRDPVTGNNYLRIDVKPSRMALHAYSKKGYTKIFKQPVHETATPQRWLPSVPEPKMWWDDNPWVGRQNL